MLIDIINPQRVNRFVLNIFIKKYPPVKNNSCEHKNLYKVYLKNTSLNMCQRLSYAQALNVHR
jgi:hypothetical protein